MVKFEKVEFLNPEGYELKKNTLWSKYILPLATILNDHREHYYPHDKPNIFYSNIILVNKLAKEYQHEILKYHPQFIDEFEDSGVFQELIYLLQKYKTQLKEYKNWQQGNKSLDILTEKSLKQFYKFFDDKNFKLNKTTYLELKDIVQNDKSISAKRLVDIIPMDCPLLKWMNHYYAR